MNSIRLQHPGANRYVLGGAGKLYVNGHPLEGVLEFKPDFMDRNSVSSVTIRLAVSRFTYGPEEAQPAACVASLKW